MVDAEQVEDTLCWEPAKRCNTPTHANTHNTHTMKTQHRHTKTATEKTDFIERSRQK